MLRLRPLFATLFLLLAALAVAGQAVASASASYSDCCLHGCDSLVQCTSAACQACAAPQIGPATAALPGLACDTAAWPLIALAGAATLAREPWRPPD